MNKHQILFALKMHSKHNPICERVYENLEYIHAIDPIGFEELMNKWESMNFSNTTEFLSVLE